MSECCQPADNQPENTKGTVGLLSEELQIYVKKIQDHQTKLLEKKNKA